MARSSVVGLRTLSPLNPENDVTVYIVVEDFGHLGRAFLETDLAEADLGTIVRNMISGSTGTRCGSSPSTPSKGGPGMCPRKSPTMCSTGLTIPTQH
jgi:hypothetical protein